MGGGSLAQRQAEAGAPAMLAVVGTVARERARETLQLVDGQALRRRRDELARG
jgi:hypothetical protein